MSLSKTALKAAKAAIDTQSWSEAVSQAERAVAADPKSYLANVLLGRGLDGFRKDEEAARAYLAATRIKPEEPPAWQGLIRLYEKQGTTRVDEYREVALRLAEVYMHNEDRYKCQDTVDKCMLFAKKHGTSQQYVRALELIVPASSVFECLEGIVPQPSSTYIKIASIIEIEEKERINRLIGERRTRLGAKITQVTEDVRREVLSHSDLEDVYEKIIEWSNDDEVRRQYEEKLLRHAHEKLIVLKPGEKSEQLIKVQELARGMVIIKHPYLLAWEITLEWSDKELFADHDLGILQEYIGFFPEDGLAKILRAYLNSDISPFASETSNGTGKIDDGANDTHEGQEAEHLSDADRLLLMADGYESKSTSILAGRLMADYYLSLEEYESAVEASRATKKLIQSAVFKIALTLEQTLDAVNITLATGLIYYEMPRNHQEAKSLFEYILARKPAFTSALIGVGLILEEQEDFASAVDFLTRAIQRDPENVRIRAECAWCRALTEGYEQGLESLEECLPRLKGVDARTKELKALTLYRIGRCKWELEPDAKARKDRKGAYACFLASLQANMHFAPAYTSLGIYYLDYAKDKKRARKCFQKAFELSPSEIEAGERLARALAGRGEWDLVEIVAQRVVDSGRAKPTPGSNKRGISWPFAALGVADLNKQDYPKAITSFQAALRITPDDYHSWVGLGESYHNSGRYIAATKAFQQAAKVNSVRGGRGFEETWFAMYMLANVKRELGDFDEAIAEYEAALTIRPNEFGIHISLLQTLVEGAWRSLDTGFFGKAVSLANKAFALAEDIIEAREMNFNFWKTVADACSVLSFAAGPLEPSTQSQIQRILRSRLHAAELDVVTEIDGIDTSTIESLTDQTPENSGITTTAQYLHCAILASKRAIQASANDIHAQAVAWYNLGWAEYRANYALDQEILRMFQRTQQESPATKAKSRRHRREAVRCFKRAIELEAGNAEFWNALGIVTSQINPQVAQHSLIRALHINEKNARIWTNLGALYLLREDLQLANEAFNRAQSTDPDYAPAWLGQGLLAQLWGDSSEAQSLFTHAFEIAESSSTLSRRLYAVSSFDRLLASPKTGSNILELVQPLFASQQWRTLAPGDISSRHLSALYLERIGDYPLAKEVLEQVYTIVEQDYEVSDSANALAHSAIIKADLGRIQLAMNEPEAAIDSAEIAVQFADPSVLEEGSQDALSAAARLAIRLSAYLTIGLASTDEATSEEAFNDATQIFPDDPDILTLRAQTLRSKDGSSGIQKARATLQAAAKRHPEHLATLLLHTAIAILDDDLSTLERLIPQLHLLRSSAAMTVDQEQAISLLLATSPLLLSPKEKDAAFYAIQSEIALRPSNPRAWTLMSHLRGDPQAADTAVLLTRAMVSSAMHREREINACTLARAFVETGRLADLQRAIALAPWSSTSWVSLGQTIASHRGST